MGNLAEALKHGPRQALVRMLAQDWIAAKKKTSNN
jgi:hypothetical protein